MESSWAKAGNPRCSRELVKSHPQPFLMACQSSYNIYENDHSMLTHEYWSDLGVRYERQETLSFITTSMPRCTLEIVLCAYVLASSGLVSFNHGSRDRANQLFLSCDKTHDALSRRSFANFIELL